MFESLSLRGIESGGRTMFFFMMGLFRELFGWMEVVILGGEM